ncbi:hypothetical protein A9B99_18620 [Mangrovibacter phragmitis]|uniref:Uncharacterized protein n=1 Tax=Mangrovibacter phragmitis TaxID=1691903 RepID=A0A1B7L744_9ENTR|nr:hypothetical protein [Mangrovibacter phragmitis]OAT78153.1 hypothetical protein A9B99_18620 [Mangrovibacter phragmitis]
MNKTIIENIKTHETFTVATITALCYAGSYAYERGFSIYFGIPTEFITVTPNSIVTSAILFITFCMSFYILSSFLIKISEKIGNNNIHIYGMIVLSPLILFVYIVLSLINALSLTIFLTSTILYILMVMSITLTIKKSTEINVNTDVTDKSAFSKIDNFITSIFWLAIIFFIITSSTGNFIARTTDSFNVFQYNNEEYRIIKTYGDNVITQKINKDIKPKGVFVFTTEDLKGKLITQPQKNDFFE